MKRKLIVAGLLAVFAEPIVAAQAPSNGLFWRAVREPATVEALIAFEQIRDFNSASRFSDASQFEIAVDWAERAYRMAPEDIEVRYRFAEALFGGPRSSSEADERIRALLIAVRSEDPEYRTREVAFQLGIIATRQHDFDTAVAEYSRAAQASLTYDASAQTISNLAEVTMLAGDLERAVQHYRRAISLVRMRSTQVQTLALSQFGLAVALDRLGEGDAALEEVRPALANPDGAEVLTARGVFYEPEYEIHYYQALAALGRAESASSSSERDDYRAEARMSFDVYQRLSQGATPWASVVEAHLRKLTR